jgi:hypothetical protein
MRCGEQYTSSVCGAGSSEQACGCGLVYRVETLTVDAVTCDDEVESANEASFWEAIH